MLMREPGPREIIYISWGGSNNIRKEGPNFDSQNTDIIPSFLINTLAKISYKKINTIVI